MSENTENTTETAIGTPGTILIAWYSRRKAATARVYFRHGTGKITINGRTLKTISDFSHGHEPCFD